MNQTIITQKALDFAARLSHIYFEERDCSLLYSYMEPRTSWIGTGEDELSHNFAEAEQALTNEMKEYKGRFRLTESSFEAVPLSNTLCVVYGRIKAIPEDRALSDEDMRISLVLELTGEELRLVHMHFSHADEAQEKGHYYVSQDARMENQTLRSELSYKEQQIDNLTKNIPGGVHQCLNDSALTLISMSDGFLEMSGYTRAEVETIFQGSFMNMVYPDDRDKMKEDVRKQLGRGRDIELEYRVQRKDMPPLWILDKGRLLDNGDGTSCFYCLLMEITDRKKQEEELRLSLESHQIITDQVTDIIFEWDILNDVLKFSPNWKKRFGYDAIREKISRRIPRSSNIFMEDMPAFVRIMEDTARGVPYSETEFRIKDVHGEYMWCRIRATTQYDSEGKPVRAVGVIVDIDEEKRQKQKLIEQVQHDAQTGLYNKASIDSVVINRMRQTSIACLQALLIIDIDHFKSVNDTYGHLCGDWVLSNVAKVLKQNKGTDDFAGRIGGDEFLVYFPEVADEQEVRRKAQRLLEGIQAIVPKKGAPPITCSVGAALVRGGDDDYYGLYQYADMALYQRKKKGRAGITFYKENA